MYNEIIEKLKPHIEHFVNNFRCELINAFNLHSKALINAGVEDFGIRKDDFDKTSKFIFYSDNKEDVKEALDVMQIRIFFNMAHYADTKPFYFTEYGNILSDEDIKLILEENFAYFMYETLEKPWQNKATQTLYKEIWEIVENNKYGVK